MKISWDYSKDRVTIAYDPNATSPDKLAAVIRRLGYKVELVEPSSTSGEGSATPKRAPIPKNAPKFFVYAMTRSSARRRPVVIDFWAEWCAPCKALKDKTMADPDVANLLSSVEVIFVDLDRHPDLAKAYGVTSIPDVFFVNAEGEIVDRLREYEDATPFRKRLEKIVPNSTKRGLSAQDSRETASRLVSPEDPVEAVRSAFNAAKGKLRFVAVLSPT